MNGKIKKTLALLASGLLVLTSVAACTSSEGGENLSSAEESSAAESNESVQESSEIEVSDVVSQVISMEPERSEYVYEGARIDYLLPFEDYSWERKYAPEFVMIHFISNVVNNRKNPYDRDAIRDIFVDYNLSIHYIIQRDGTVECYMPEDRVAWHAGGGEYLGDAKYTDKMNHYAIGIEIAAMGSEEDMSIYLTSSQYKALDESLLGFSEEQYAALKPLVEDICKRNNIPMDRTHIIGHEEYSPTKNDPGELFDWSRIVP